MKIINCLPVNDTTEHQESKNCACQPTVEDISGNFLIIHNAYDKREIIEQAEEIVNNP